MSQLEQVIASQLERIEQKLDALDKRSMSTHKIMDILFKDIKEASIDDQPFEPKQPIQDTFLKLQENNEATPQTQQPQVTPEENTQDATPTTPAQTEENKTEPETQETKENPEDQPNTKNNAQPDNQTNQDAQQQNT